jgi:hypothetical protein
MSADEFENRPIEKIGLFPIALRIDSNAGNISELPFCRHLRPRGAHLQTSAGRGLAPGKFALPPPFQKAMSLSRRPQ